MKYFCKQDYSFDVSLRPQSDSSCRIQSKRAVIAATSSLSAKPNLNFLLILIKVQPNTRRLLLTNICTD